MRPGLSTFSLSFRKPRLSSLSPWPSRNGKAQPETVFAYSLETKLHLPVMAVGHEYLFVKTSKHLGPVPKLGWMVQLGFQWETSNERKKCPHKTLSDCYSAVLTPLYNSNIAKVSIVKWYQKLNLVTLNVVCGIP